MARIIIVGGGIGGLTAALSLHQAGLQPIVLERSASNIEAGAGIQLAPNAMRILTALGLGGELAACALVPEAVQLRSGRSGRQWLDVPLRDAEQRWGAAYLHMHRADLARILAEALQLRAPGALRTDCPVSSCIDDGGEVRAVLENGEQIAGSLLIGADGRASSIGRQIGARAADRHYIAWRCLVPLSESPDHLPEALCVWTGSGRHAVTYLVRCGRSGSIYSNFVGIVAKSKGQALSDFVGWDQRLLDLLASAPLVHRSHVYQHKHQTLWQSGRIGLLGDAGHSILPFLGQGAAMAIEDAWILAKCLVAKKPDSVSGLQLYQAERQQRLAFIAGRSRRQGWLYHSGGALLRLLGRRVFFAPAVALSALEPIYGADIDLHNCPDGT